MKYYTMLDPNVFVRRAHPLKDRINSVNSAFAHDRLLIDPKCKSLRNCLNKLSTVRAQTIQIKTADLII